VSSRIHKNIQAFGDKVLIDGKVFDPKTGRVVEILPPRPANTFLQNWIKSLYSNFSGANLANVTDTSGSANTISGGSYNILGLNAGSTVTTFGIVIGNQVGPTAVTLSDTKLQAQVTANVAHAAMVFSLNAPDGTHYQVIIARTFTNNTGSTLAITEVGIYTKDMNATKYYCSDRTLVSLSVGSGLAVTITYTWTTHT
jgi:hypothetical protein